MHRTAARNSEYFCILILYNIKDYNNILILQS